MQTLTVETARIRLRADAREADLIAASDRFQTAFLDQQPGFRRRELLRLGDRDYLDLVHWTDRAAADAAMVRAMTSPDCRAYFALMDMDAPDSGAGVSFHDSLALYGTP